MPLVIGWNIVDPREGPGENIAVKVQAREVSTVGSRPVSAVDRLASDTDITTHFSIDFAP